ncbi:MAG: YigZ family protein [Clostridiales bacterium]|nr:YigZ family protein [Clostridiales bacterium]
MQIYRSVYGCGEAEYTVERSRFITHVSPAETPEEARAFIAGIKEKYKDATHNVPAFVCGAGSEHQWASDDGEPQGTSGMPVLRLLTGEGLTNVAIVITRYFGGIKLGTGGLARAYTHAASLGIESAGICEVRESALLSYSFDYQYLSKLQSMAEDGRFEMDGLEYTDTVSAVIKCPSENREAVKSAVSDLTSGRAVLKSETSAPCRYLLQKID